MVTLEPTAKLNDKGRCCGRKPMVYKTRHDSFASVVPYKWCPRCGRSFDPATGLQVENSEWREFEDGFALRRRFA